MRINRMYIVILILLVTVISFSCSKPSNQPSQNSRTTVPAQEMPKKSEDDEDNITKNKFANRIPIAKDIADSESWIKTVNPLPDEKAVDDSAVIDITFNYDMDESTLNRNNIIIGEGKHSSIISDLFDYKYDKNTRVLHIKFKEAGNGYGSDNWVAVLISGEIKNSKNENMKINVKFGFLTK